MAFINDFAITANLKEWLLKTIQESDGVIDQKSLRTWNSDYDSLFRAYESINQLTLMPESINNLIGITISTLFLA